MTERIAFFLCGDIQRLVGVQRLKTGGRAGGKNGHPMYHFAGQDQRYWGQHFWARGYFCVTAGELSQEMIDEYLAHHFEPSPNDGFDIAP